MKILSIALSSVGALLTLYTMICGLWIHRHGATPEEVAYHGRFGTTGSIVMTVGLVLLVFQKSKS